MKKIPVLSSIRYAYGFTFGHLGTIIGLVWLPMVILAVAGYFVMSHYYGTFPAAVAEGNPAAIGQSAVIVLMWSLVSLLISAIMYTAITQHALGRRDKPAIVHLALGMTEIRVFGALIGFAAIIVLFLIGYGVASGTAMALSVRTALAGVKLAAGLFTLGLLLAMFYALVRLSFLLIPATVAEKKIGLARAWQLSRGNFWRIVAIGLAALGPITLVAFGAEVAILGPDFFLHSAAAPVGDKAAQMHALAEQMRIASAHLPVLYGLSFLLAPFFMGLGLAPSAAAYLALTAPDRPDSGIMQRA